MRRVEDGQRSTTCGVVHRERPGNGSAPVVAEHQRELCAAFFDETVDVSASLSAL
jgi:hypothetical protein